MITTLLLAAAQVEDPAIRVRQWAAKAKPIATCRTEDECDRKWAAATTWIRDHSRFSVSVDVPTLFATQGAIYANTDASYVLQRRPVAGGGFSIAARAWCGNVISCAPKPKTLIAELTRAIAAVE